MNYLTDQYTALGTVVEGGIRGPRAECERVFSSARLVVGEFEQRFSRFQEDSEPSRLNASAGTPFLVSDAMLALLATARDAWRQTDGIVDPTIGGALRAAGYDRSFDQLRSESESSEAVPKNIAAEGTLHDVHVDTKSKTVTVPRGTSLDFGGIGKGYLLDQLAPLFQKVTKDWWYSLGGDMLVSGTDENGSPWSVAVQDPQHLDRDWATLVPPRGQWGIATSGKARRQGVRNGTAWHHLIDPATSLPGVQKVLSATVIAPTALQADIGAKTVVLLGAERGLHWAGQQRDFFAALTCTDGTRRMTPAMEQHLIPA